MSNYQNGKIYKITGTNEQCVELNYIGSTVQPLNRRLTQHKINKTCSSTIIFETCINYEIILIENYPCKTKKDLLLRERYFCNLYDCVNINNPIYYDGELDVIKQHYRINNIDKKKEYNKQYHINNIEKEKERGAVYRINNIDKIKEYNKQYRINNIEKEKERGAVYRINNIDKKKEYNKQYHINNIENEKERGKQYRLKKKIELQNII